MTFILLSRLWWDFAIQAISDYFCSAEAEDGHEVSQVLKKTDRKVNREMALLC